MRLRAFRLGAAVASVLAVSGIPQAYVLSGHYWGTSSVNYFVNPVNGDMSQQAATASLQAAAANWYEQSGANVRFVYAGQTSGTSLQNNGKNEVFFQKRLERIDRGGNVLVVRQHRQAAGRGHHHLRCELQVLPGFVRVLRRLLSGGSDHPRVWSRPRHPAQHSRFGDDVPDKFDVVFTELARAGRG